MRILGERSLVSILKVIIDVAYYGVLLLGVVVVLALVLALFARPEGLSLELPASFEIDSSTYEITSTRAEAVDVLIENARGDVNVKGVNRRQVALGFAVAVLLLVIAVFVLRQFRGIFRTLTAGTPFVHANITRIRMLGLTVMFGEVVRAALVSWSSGELSRNFSSEVIRFRADFEPSLLVISRESCCWCWPRSFARPRR